MATAVLVFRAAARTNCRICGSSRVTILIREVLQPSESCLARPGHPESNTAGSHFSHGGGKLSEGSRK